MYIHIGAGIHIGGSINFIYLMIYSTAAAIMVGENRDEHSKHPLVAAGRQHELDLNLQLAHW